MATTQEHAPCTAELPPRWREMDGLRAGFGDRAVTAPAGTLLLGRQVHGIRIVDPAHRTDHLRGDPADSYPRLAQDADALIAAGRGLVVGVRTADCVPILLVAPQARWSAAIHAGWRGTVAGIAVVAVRAAGEAGVRSDQLLAVLGPSIGPCCYEVSVELGDQFENAGLPVRWPPPGPPVGASTKRSTDLSPLRPKPHLDLRAANRLLLEGCGVPAANVENVGPCTRCASDRYHSFRAEPESPGRQISWVGWE